VAGFGDFAPEERLLGERGLPTREPDGGLRLGPLDAMPAGPRRLFVF